MLFMLTLGVLLGIAGATLVRQWLTGALLSDDAAGDALLTPHRYPHLAPPRRATTTYRLRRRAA